jgi:hypothetical protein
LTDNFTCDLLVSGHLLIKMIFVVLVGFGLMTSKILVTLVALVNLFGTAKADYNETHIFNPLWTPHSIFHDGQTILLSIMLGLCALYFCWLAKGDSRHNMFIAITFASLYWITQSMSALFPGAAFFDSNVQAVYVGPLPVQLAIDLTIFAVLTVAAMMVGSEPKIVAQ